MFTLGLGADVPHHAQLFRLVFESRLMVASFRPCAIVEVVTKEQVLFWDPAAQALKRKRKLVVKPLVAPLGDAVMPAMPPLADAHREYPPANADEEEEHDDREHDDGCAGEFDERAGVDGDGGVFDDSDAAGDLPTDDGSDADSVDDVVVPVVPPVPPAAVAPRPPTPPSVEQPAVGVPAAVVERSARAPTQEAEVEECHVSFACVLCVCVCVYEQCVRVCFVTRCLCVAQALKKHRTRRSTVSVLRRCGSKAL